VVVEQVKRQVRWEEVDPYGQTIVCTEDVWEAKAAKHGEIPLHEAAIRETLRDPDSIWFDPISTAQKRPGSAAEVEVLFYISNDRGVGRYRGKLIVVVVKRLVQTSAPPEAYVQTMMVLNEAPGRLVWRWSRVQ
jgi:hypothetical protein